MERKYQERACLLYLILLLALLASFCLYVQQRVSLRSNPQIATSIEPDKSFPAPNMVRAWRGGREGGVWVMLAAASSCC